MLYVGITNDLPSRVDRHAAGLGGAFSKNYRLARLLFFETYGDARRAIAREKEIKGWRREKKLDLIESINPGWEDLSQGWFEEDSSAPSRK